MSKNLSNVDIDLLKRFDKPGPRYTSYPTAPMFSSAYDDKRYEVDLIVNNDENLAPLSLYLHIPFCDTLCYFCGCTTVVTRNRDHLKKYVTALKNEIAKASTYLNRSRRVNQMHWGGGTPSFLSPQEITELSAFITDRFQSTDDAEVSVEIDPRDLTIEHMKAFRQSGVNRISLGVQDFDERVQKAVNRIQPEHLTRQAISWAKSLGIDDINIDLIYGLPLQTVETFRATLDKIIEIAPNRIAAFNFAYVPWMKPHQKLIQPEDLPSPEMKLQLLKTTIDTLTDAGYEYIGMDHFAKPEDELAIAQKQKLLHRNFQGYSTKAGMDLFGFGMSAISHFGAVYAQNAKTLSVYEDALNEGRFATAVGYKMTQDDHVRKFVIMRLMCDLEVDKKEVENEFSLTFDSYFEESLDQLEDFIKLGLVRTDATRIYVELPGRFLLRNIAMCFDAYLNKIAKEKPIFSRTV